MTWLLKSLPINLRDLLWSGPMHQSFEVDETDAEFESEILEALRLGREERMLAERSSFTRSATSR